MTNPQHGYPQQTVVIHAPPSNGLGVAGFIISLIGLLVTGGILCPIGLLLSFIALFKPPRGFAIAGTILGAIGTIIPLVIFLIFGATIFACLGIGLAAAASESGTTSVLSQADSRIQSYHATHSKLPGDFEGNNLIDDLRDGGGQRLRYYQNSARDYEIRSSGTDGRFNTTDDRVRRNAVFPTTTLPTRPRGSTTSPRTRTPLEPN